MRVERLTRLEVDLFDIASLEDFVRVTPDMVPEAARLADAAARDLENYASLALLNQSIRVTLDSWPTRNSWPEAISLPIAPYVSGAALSVTVGGVNFNDLGVLAGIRPAVWLDGIDCAPEGEAIITYTAGFGGTRASIPPDLRHAILDQAAVGFDLRGQSDPKFGTGLSPHMARVAARYRRVGV